MKAFQCLATVAFICVLQGMSSFCFAATVKVTAYTAGYECGHVTASGVHLKKKHCWVIVAFNPRLAGKYKFGDRFRLEIEGKVYIVEFQDRMAPRRRGKANKAYIDFLLPSVEACRQFGVKRGTLTKIE